MSEATSALVTLLFTDLVGSTELLARAGDEEAQRIFSAHHQLLNQEVAHYGGHEVKWLGDGLMVAFPSAADAVSCAIAMQQAAHRPVEGENLAIRVGLTAGEALRDETDYFGTPVVTAKRLCDRAEAGQILCSDLVAGLLSGRPGFAFAAMGELELKGLPNPVPAYEVSYEETAVSPWAAEIPLVGREGELARLTERVRSAAGGRGGLALVAGEPGIGKTRLAEEVAAQAERDGAYVLWGRCFEGDWAPPYGPFAEALAPHVAVASPEELRADLGTGAGPLAQLVPRIREVLPDLPEPQPIPPEEERFRLLDAMAGFLVARSRRAPVLLVLDDLHWADRSTVAMVRHLVRFAPRERILLLGAYPEGDLDAAHPLTELLGVVAREAGYEHLHLKGLDPAEVTQLLAALGGHEVEQTVGAAWVRRTEGNPFFIQELLRHLIEEGSLYQRPDGRWTTTKPLVELGVPERIREVVARRVARLSKAATQLLQAAAAFDGTFRFDVAASIAGLSELDALDALDEGLAAHLLVPAGADETYAFVRTLIRQTEDRAEAARILREAHLDPFGPAPMEAGGLASREEALTSTNVILQFYWCGEYAWALPRLETEADQALSGGQLARSARCRAFVSMCHASLGSLDEARDALDQTQALGARMGIPVPSALQAREALAIATDEGLEELAAALAPLTASVIPPIAWLLGCLYAWSGRIAARLGRPDDALRSLALLVPWLERAPAWTIGLPVMGCHAAETLWVLERDQHLDVIDSALRDKIVGPDFRTPGPDGRLALARLCGLSRRYDEAVSWFGDARRVLTDQGCRPLLAIADYDEGLMYARRGEPGDTERARPLVEAAKKQFDTLGMTGWTRRAQELAGQLA